MSIASAAFIERQVRRGMSLTSATRGAHALLCGRFDIAKITDAEARRLAAEMCWGAPAWQGPRERIDLYRAGYVRHTPADIERARVAYLAARGGAA